MSATSNLGNLGPSQFGQFGQYTVDSANDFYCTPLKRTPVTEVSADTAGNITYTLAGSPDLSEIVKGAKVITANCPSEENNGIKFVSSFVDSANTVTVTNNGIVGVDETSDKAFLEIHAPKTLGFDVRSDITISTIEYGNNRGASASTSGYTAGTTKLGDIRELTVSEGEAELYFAPDFLSPEEA